jgi:hypothetical protein
MAQILAFPDRGYPEPVLRRLRLAMHARRRYRYITYLPPRVRRPGWVLCLLGGAWKFLAGLFSPVISACSAALDTITDGAFPVLRQ